jgi:hypothetical protein
MLFVVVAAAAMLNYCPNICLNRLRVPSEYVSQDNCHGGLNSNPGAPKYNEGVLNVAV